MSTAPRFFKHWAESVLGEGVAFMEARGEWIVRQVEIYGPCIVWCNEQGQSDDRFMLADQPLSDLGLTVEDEIYADEFEAVWRRAKAAKPCL